MCLCLINEDFIIKIQISAAKKNSFDIVYVVYAARLKDSQQGSIGQSFRIIIITCIVKSSAIVHVSICPPRVAAAREHRLAYWSFVAQFPVPTSSIS